MTAGSEITVNFGKPVALFPLHTVTLFPQQVLPLQVFEPRYRQLVDHALDGPGQIAMAVFDGDGWKENYNGRPPLRSAVCIGQIMEHEKLDDGRYAIILQGICRARILAESPPAEDRLYREARLAPLESEDRADYESQLSTLRTQIDEMLSDGELSLMHVSEKLLHFVQNDDIPTHVVMELVSFAIVTQPELKYRLLETGSVLRRSELILTELKNLSSVIRRAARQGSKDWPKGCSWN